MVFARIFAPLGVVLLLLTAACLRAQMPLAAVMPEAPDVLAFPEGAVVPAWPIARLLNGQVTYRDQKLTVTCADATVRYRVGKPTVEWTKKRQTKKADFAPAPVEVYGEVYVPLASLVEALEGKLERDAQQGICTLTVGALTLRLRERAVAGVAAQYRDAGAEQYLAGLDGSGCNRLTFSESPAALPAFSPDGDAIAFTRDGALYLRALKEPAAKRLAAAGKRVYANPCFTPDGQSLLFTCTEDGRSMVGTIKIDGSGESLLLDGASPRFLAGAKGGGIGTVLSNNALLRGGAEQGFRAEMLLLTIRRQAVTGMLKLLRAEQQQSSADVLADWRGIAPGDKAVPSSQLFSYLTAEHSIGLAHPTLGLPLNITPAFPSAADSPAFAPTGAMVWTVRDEEGSDINYAGKLGDAPVTVAAGHTPALSPDGKLVVYLDAGDNLMLFDVASKNTRCLLPSWMGSLARPSFTPDGTEIVFIRSGQLCATRMEGKGIRTITKDMVVREYAYSPNGKQIVFIAQP